MQCDSPQHKFTFLFRMSVTVIYMSLLVASTFPQSGAPCPESFFGVDCSESCHCVEGPAYCDAVDGRCTQGDCENGWTNGPYCQTQCGGGTFGPACSLACHCPDRDFCSNINGLCNSGHCLQGWTGASCQIRLPMLTDPPCVEVNDVPRSNCSMMVTWPPFSAQTGVGSVPVTDYVLQLSTAAPGDGGPPGGAWSDLEIISHVAFMPKYQQLVPHLCVDTPYSFRIKLRWLSDGKPKDSVPGPESPPVLCSRFNATAPPHIKAAPAENQTGLLGVIVRHGYKNGAQVASVSIVWANPDAHSSQADHGFWLHIAPSRDGQGVDLAEERYLDEGRFSQFSVEPSTIYHYSLLQSVNSMLDVKQSLRNGTFDTPPAAPEAPPAPVIGAVGSTSVEVSIPAAKGRTEMRVRDVHEAPQGNRYNGDAGPSGASAQMAARKAYQVSPTFLEQVFSRGGGRRREVDLDVAPKGQVDEVWVDLANFVIPTDTRVEAYEVIVERLADNASGSALELEIGGPPAGTLDPVIFRKVYSSTGLNANVCMLNSVDAHGKGLPYYVTAVLPLPESGLEEDLTVAIGNGTSKNGTYLNVYLEPNTWYLVWVARSLSFGGYTVRSFTRALTAVQTLKGAQKPGVAWFRLMNVSVSSLVVTIVISSILIFALAAIAVFFVVRWRRQMRHSHSGDIASYHRGDTLTDQYLKHFPPTPPLAVANTNTNNCSVAPPVDVRRVYRSCDPLDAINSGPEIIHLRKKDDVDSYFVMKKTNPILVKDLRTYIVQREKVEQSLAEEFQHLPDNFIDTVNIATQPQNARRNRSAAVIPYDKNRVKLTKCFESEMAYINASSVQGMDRSMCIVTQTPMSITIGDFWRLVWEQEVGTIVMLMDLVERGKPDSEMYWPRKDHIETYGDVRVELLNEERTAHYKIHDFRIAKIGQGLRSSREVTHYQFASWTPGGVPVHPVPFVDFVRRVQDEKDKELTTLVHCHAGGGRSGVYLALDALLTQGRQTGRVDVLKCVTLLRSERRNLVKTLKQYRCVHECLAESFEHPESRIVGERFSFAFDNLLNVRTPTRMSILGREYDDLRSRTLLHDRLAPAGCHHTTNTNSHSNTNNNNSTSVFSDFSVFHSPKRRRRAGAATAAAAAAPDASSSHRRVEMDGQEDEASELSSSSSTTTSTTITTVSPVADWVPNCNTGPVYLDSFRLLNAFIVALSPGPEHLEDFWNMLVENGARCIVHITSGECSGDLAPMCDPVSPLQLLSHSSKGITSQYDMACKWQPRPLEFNNLRETSLNLHQEDLGGSQLPPCGECRIHSFQWHGWPADQATPSVHGVLDLLCHVRRWQGLHTRSQPVVLHCPQGLGRAALLSLVWLMCERLEDEWLIDVYSCTKFIQTYVSRAVCNLEQYRFLYRVMKEHVHRLDAEEKHMRTTCSPQVHMKTSTPDTGGGSGGGGAAARHATALSPPSGLSRRMSRRLEAEERRLAATRGRDSRKGTPNCHITSTHVSLSQQE